MHIKKIEYQTPEFYIIKIETDDIVRTSTDFDEGQSGLFL